MAYFVLTCLDHPNGLDRRMAAREAHLAYVRERLETVKLAGPFLDEAGTMIGSMFILEAADQAAAQAFADADPYKLADVFQSAVLRPFRMTIGAIA